MEHTTLSRDSTSLSSLYNEQRNSRSGELIPEASESASDVQLRMSRPIETNSASKPVSGQLKAGEGQETFKDGVEFDHPGREDRLFREAVDVGQRANPALHAQPEHVAKILRR